MVNHIAPPVINRHSISTCASFSPPVLLCLLLFSLSIVALLLCLRRFHLSGDDDYINPHYLLKKLENYDADQPLFFGGPTWGPVSCAHNHQEVHFPSGGLGIVASRGLLKMTHDKMSHWIENIWLKGAPGGTRDLGDVASLCFFDDMGVNMTHIRGFRIWTPKEPGFEHSMLENHSQYHEEVNNWHYVRMEIFLYADILFGQQMVDRMHRNGQVEELAAYTRQLIMERFASEHTPTQHLHAHTISCSPSLTPLIIARVTVGCFVVGCFRSKAEFGHHHRGEEYGRWLWYRTPST